MSTLLIVDDEPNLLYSLKKGLETDALRVITAETAEGGLVATRKNSPDVIILDVRLPDMSGLDAFVEIRKIDSRIPVILITAYSTTETAIEAMKRGAYEYLLKPVSLDTLNETVERALEISRMSRVPAEFEEDVSPGADHIVGRSAGMQEVYKAIGRVAPQDVTVLITGESGTGKEMIARAIYHHSRRAKDPFLAINCPALPDSILESELFGHERGSFTGADRRRIGKFEQVDGGTIFLDEIGDMSPATQSKVLRLLQDGTFERVGSNETVRVDVRVIAATNKDLARMVENGEFRKDLYYRLKVFTIELPPMRRRMEDLPLLVKHFLEMFNRDLGKKADNVSPEVMEIFKKYDWPGNVRELESEIKQALVRSVSGVLTADCLSQSSRKRELEQEDASESPYDSIRIRKFVRDLIAGRQSDIYRTLHSEIDRILLPEVLNHCDGNQAQASELLGISRSTLRTRINDLGLTFEKKLKANFDRSE
ncbi:MAG: sigma-54 dependent transcriptional regulator [Acidobacteriota bacterium]